MKRTFAAAGLLLALSLLGPAIHAQACGEDWRWADPLPQGNTLNAVAWGNRTFVAAGECGALITSKNGANWTIPPRRDLNGFYTACFDGRRFLVGGEAGTILSSTDGNEWTDVPSGTSVSIHSIAYGPPGYVAAGYDWDSYPPPNILLTSHDGQSWQPRLEGFEGWFRSAIWAGSRFVVLGTDLTGAETILLTSADGSEWSQTILDPSINLFSIAYGNEGFVAAGAPGDPFDPSILYVSQDAIHWTIVDPGLSFPASVASVVFTSEEFLIVGDGTEYSVSLIATSPDGVTWTDRSIQTSRGLKQVTSGGSHYVAVGLTGTVLVSDYSILWSEVSHWLNSDTLLWAAAYGAGRYVAVGGWEDGDPRRIFSSSDAVNWEVNYSDLGSALWGVTYGAGTFVAVGGYGEVFTSLDGISWACQAGFKSYFGDVAYGNSRFVITQYGGSIVWTSPDGLSWTQEPAIGGNSSINAITYAASSFVAVGYNNVTLEALALTSRDGKAWSRHETHVPGRLKDVAFGNGRFVAVGEDQDEEGAIVLTSSDGLTWTEQAADLCDLITVVFGGGRFVALSWCWPTLVATSLDGATWTVQRAFEGLLSGLCYGNGRYVAVGDAMIWGPCDWVPDPIVISGVSKKAPPFSLTLTGSNLQYGMQVFINGREWPKVQWNPPISLTLKGGATLKAQFQKGIPTDILLKNPDGGELSLTWTR